jgi:alkaline phosphatase D
VRRALASLGPVTLFVALVAAAPAGPAAKLQSGPMVGYSEPREVLLWAQTTAPARVRFAYWEEGRPQPRLETEERQTRRDEAFVAKLVADRVAPGRRYAYELLIDGQRVERPYPLRFQARALARFRAEPPTFRIAVGSCYYRNDPADVGGWNPGDEYGIFEAIARQQPDAMLWLGDNLYLREQDWTSRTGILDRYTHQRSLPELQALLGSVHHYAIWDDHDYGPNDSDRSFRGKHLSLEAFRLFWGNPSYGVEGSRGITTRFVWGDAEFFLLDNRWNRTPNFRITGERRILGAAQVEWLLDALASSGAPLKVVVVGGQVLNPVRTAETYANFPEEREELVRRITEERVRGVLLVTGDRHFTELSRLERPGSYALYDFTVSPLTVTPVGNADREPNPLRVPDTLVTRRNFGTLELRGSREEREVVLSAWSSGGERFWSRAIRLSELQP